MDRQLSSSLLLNWPPDLVFQFDLLLFQEGTRESNIYHSSVKFPLYMSSCPLILFPTGLHLLVLEADLSSDSN